MIIIILYFMIILIINLEGKAKYIHSYTVFYLKTIKYISLIYASDIGGARFIYSHLS